MNDPAPASYGQQPTLTPAQRDWLPDFLGIGAQKAGTSWLYENLVNHPEIWFPTRKEIHYFDRSPKYRSTSLLATRSLARRIIGKEKPEQEWRTHCKRYFSSRFPQQIRKGRWAQLLWDVRFFLGRYDDRWYATLFRPGTGKVCGEITPAYSILDREDVEPIARLQPNLKIIFIMRNPIDRDWSMLRFALQNHERPMESFQNVEFINLLNTPEVVQRGDYLRTIENWKACFPDEQFFFCFYDEIEEDPLGLLQRLVDFLAVAPVGKHPFRPTLHKKVNVSPKFQIPPKVKAYLAERYYSQIETLAEMFGEYPARWLEELKV